MKRRFGGAGRGYEDQPGAMLLGAWGEKQDARKQLNRRSNGAYRCVTDLIDYMITESKKDYAGTNMEDRFLMTDVPSTVRFSSGTRTRRRSTSDQTPGLREPLHQARWHHFRGHQASQHYSRQLP